MVVAFAQAQAHQRRLPDARILEREQLLSAAKDMVAQLTISNAERTRQIADAEMRNEKLKLNSRNDESALKQQLTDAQNRRF